MITKFIHTTETGLKYLGETVKVAHVVGTLQSIEESENEVRMAINGQPCTPLLPGYNSTNPDLSEQCLLLFVSFPKNLVICWGTVEAKTR